MRNIFSLTKEEIKNIANLSGRFNNEEYFISKDYYLCIESITDYGCAMNIFTDGSIDCICKDDNSSCSYNGAIVMKYLFTLDLNFEDYKYD